MHLAASDLAGSQFREEQVTLGQEEFQSIGNRFTLRVACRQPIADFDFDVGLSGR